ncbi:hypothetical protein [Massilia sp. SYSU DXS3249]
MIRQAHNAPQAARQGVAVSISVWGIIEGSIQLTQNAKIMEAERINAISALLNDLTGREAELRRYL